MDLRTSCTHVFIYNLQPGVFIGTQWIPVKQLVEMNVLSHQLQILSLNCKQTGRPVTKDGCKLSAGNIVVDQSNGHILDWLFTAITVLYDVKPQDESLSE